MRLIPLVGLAMPLALLMAPAGVAAAGGCQLTTSVDQGHTIALSGSGFAANGTVALTQTWSGSNATLTSPTGAQVTHASLAADASGTFSRTIDAGPGHGGLYEFSATGGGCTATARAEAVETAGGVRPGGVGMTPPPTDSAPVADRSGQPAMPVVAVLIGSALVGWVLGVRRRRHA